MPGFFYFVPVTRFSIPASLHCKASFGTSGQEFMQRAEHLPVITPGDNSISFPLFSGSALRLSFYNIPG
jgi:hypothetical protein